MPKSLIKSNTYPALVRKVSRELSELELFIKRRWAEGYWQVGKYIHEHLLAHEKRAEYGATLYEKLAKDVGRDATTLSRAVRFYRTYPILAPGQELTWGHYRTLITIKDKAERSKLEREIIRKNWDTHEVQEYLSAKRALSAPDNNDKPVPQLKFTRGKLHTYQIVKANKSLLDRSPLVLDLGFRLQYPLPEDRPRFKEGEIAEPEFLKGGILSARKSDASPDEIFTYQAKVDKVIDADTLLTSFDFNGEVSISQKLRLRGIDCPELDTEEGKKAKRFVESRLKKCEYIIVKTYKDRTDKFDRYLADIFYMAGARDPSLIAREGKLLNQELLDERLARVWEKEING